MSKKFLKVILTVFLSFFGVGLVFIGIIIYNSPGTLKPLCDTKLKEIPGSISSKRWITVGGIKQGMFIRSENPENPVILFLHGGPGSPELPFIIPEEKNERLEKYFTVCYWDQRGAGMTFSSDIDPKTMTVDRLVEDAYEVTKYLKDTFKKDKIFLMGHSWGSFLGIKTIEKYPEEYHAYFGIGQISNQLLSEKMAHSYMMEHAKKIGDKSAIENLEKFDPDASDFPTINYILSVRTKLMNKYGIGIKHNNPSMIRLAKDILFFDGYTFEEKFKYIQGSLFSLRNLFSATTTTNLFQSSISFKIPIYIIHGVYDYQVSYILAEKYSDAIEAPKKSFFSFHQSAHSPNLEEPEKFVEIVQSIAKQTLNE